MQHDLFSSFKSFQAFSAAADPILVRDTRGQDRPAQADGVLMAAQRLLASTLRGSAVLNSPAVIKDFLSTRLAALPHEVFAVVLQGPGISQRG